MNVHPQIPGRHRTIRPTLPRAGAGAHRPAPLTVERLAGLLGLVVSDR